ncbi:ead/Ea22-like family protein [Enterobacter roggenkampii]|nr:ead/Ea22-like family protein [Enterobacter roggenkampii]
MSNIDKQWLQQKIADMEAARDEIPFGLDEDDSNTLAAMRIALASLEAEAVGEVVLGEFDDCGCHPDARVECIAADGQADWENFKDGTRLYTAPTVPVSVPDEITFEKIAEITASQGYEYSINECICAASWWNACRAAMLQGAENAESRCTIKTAPALDSLTKNAESRCGNSPVIPEGWVLVPEEPTHEMLEAGDEQFGTYDVYRRMIEAAPKLE